MNDKVKAYNEDIPAGKAKWIQLTDEEIDSIEWPANKTLSEYARAIEAKLREKNSGY